jgi:hypothetical protein
MFVVYRAEFRPPLELRISRASWLSGPIAMPVPSVQPVPESGGFEKVEYLLDPERRLSRNSQGHAGEGRRQAYRPGVREQLEDGGLGGLRPRRRRRRRRDTGPTGLDTL